MNWVRARRLSKRRSKAGQRVRLWHDPDQPDWPDDVRSQGKTGSGRQGGLPCRCRHPHA